MRITVWGTGITGRETARVMLTKGHEVRLVDEREPRPGCDIPVRMLSLDDITWADLVIPSPGIPRTHPLLKKAATVRSEVEIAASLLSGKLVAVTGTNGKTTTTTLIHRILEHAGLDAGLGGNINPPLISLVDRDPDYVAAEISSFQLEWTDSFRPRVGVCMNITPDHLDRYESMNEYAHYKLRLFENQMPADCAVLNADDPWLQDFPVNSRRYEFSLRHEVSRGAWVDGCRIQFTGDIAGPGPKLPPRDIIGDAVAEDMLAAALACRLLGVRPAVMEEVFLTFRTIHHRFEYVTTIDDVRYIDDSKATNVGAVDKALSGIEGPVVLILGGRDKGGNFAALAEKYHRQIRTAVAMGPEAARIKHEIGPFVTQVGAADMDEAVRLAARHAHPGDTVLLSPGCASFDLFTSYAQRGKVFKECVRKLQKTRS